MASALGVAEVAVQDLRRLPGGASRETWSFDARFNEGGEQKLLPLVLRRDPGPTVINSDRRQEFELLRVLHGAQVAVPRAHWLGDETETLGARFFLMERVEGETL